LEVKSGKFGNWIAFNFQPPNTTSQFQRCTTTKNKFAQRSNKFRQQQQYVAEQPLPRCKGAKERGAGGGGWGSGIGIGIVTGTGRRCPCFLRASTHLASMNV